MNRMNKLFYELIQVAIGTRVCLSHTPSVSEWHTLYDMALKQSLVGICFAGVRWLQKHQQCLPEMLYLKWLGMAAKIQQRNEMVNRQCVELTNSFCEGGFDVVVLKGQSAARRYGQLAMLRQPGDIDAWLTGDRFRIKDYIAKHYQVGEVIYNHAHVSVFKDTEVEVHFTPSWLYSPFRNRYLQKWFMSYELKNGFKFREADGFKSPSADFDVVYLLLHSFRHLMHEGVGLRQVMDYYFCLKVAFDGRINTEGDELRERTKEAVKKLGLESFAEAMMWVMAAVFGLNIKDMPWVPNKRRGEKLLNEILVGGNMGRGDDRTGKATSRIGYFVEHVARQLSFMADYPSEVLWSPLWKTWHFVMRKLGKI